MFPNTKPKSSNNSSLNKTSRKKSIRFWQPPPPLFNPYSLDYRPKTPQEPHDLFQKHYEYQRFKKERESKAINLRTFFSLLHIKTDLVN